MELNYTYKGIEFTGKYLGDNQLEIFTHDSHLCYIDLDQFENMKFEEIIESLCDDNFEELNEILYFEWKEMFNYGIGD